MNLFDEGYLLLIIGGLLLLFYLAVSFFLNKSKAHAPLIRLSLYAVIVFVVYSIIGFEGIHLVYLVLFTSMLVWYSNEQFNSFMETKEKEYLFLTGWGILLIFLSQVILYLVF